MVCIQPAIQECTMMMSTREHPRREHRKEENELTALVKAVQARRCVWPIDVRRMSAGLIDGPARIGM